MNSSSFFVLVAFVVACFGAWSYDQNNELRAAAPATSPQGSVASAGVVAAADVEGATTAPAAAKASEQAESNQLRAAESLGAGPATHEVTARR